MGNHSNSILWLALFLLLSLTGIGSAADDNLRQVTIIRLDPRFDRLVPPGAKIASIASRHKWVEGPVWNRKEGYLLFSDIPDNSVYRWQESQGVRLFLKPSGYSGKARFEGAEPGANGLTYDPAGHLVLAEHGDRRISRLEKSGRRTTLVDRYDGKRINSPNDVVFRSDGDLYFTDPPFGLPQTYDDPRKEILFSGVYKLSPTGRLTLLANAIKAPNGIAFSPDEKKLYLSNADRMNPVWLSYEVKPDGTIENGKVLFDATRFVRDKPGAPDGMKVDRYGNLFAAGPGGVYVIAADGTHLGTIDFGAPTGNVAWGEDGSTLFIASSHNIYRLKLITKGAGF